MTTKELILEQAEKTNLELKESLKNLKSVALSEAWKVLQIVIASVVQIIEEIAKDLAGSDKKAIAVEYINKFYDTTFSIIDVPLVPNILEPIIHSHVKQILMIMVEASIDATVTIFRRTGVFLKKG